MTAKKKTKPRWKAGDAVCIWEDGTKPRCRKEYGIVVATMWNNDAGWWDTWIACFGFRWPSNASLRVNCPYILRYLETSLKPYTPPKGSNGTKS